jgi:hypothetical protein
MISYKVCLRGLVNQLAQAEFIVLAPISLAAVPKSYKMIKLGLYLQQI